MCLVVPIACGDWLAVLAFTLRQWLGTGGLAVAVHPALAARAPATGCSEPGRELGEGVGMPMKLVSVGEPE